MNIRPETPRDYAVIADIHARAFGRAPEALIVSLLRHTPGYDPEFSLVAEIDRKVVGHALFIPYTISLLGEGVRTVNLAPIGVDTNYQKQGVGGALIEEGHRIARERGYTLSFLLGHDTYYPRFGYKTGVYGVSSVEISRESLLQTPVNSPPLQTRAPVSSDCNTLWALHSKSEGQVDFTVLPSDDAILDWLSPNPAIESVVYLSEPSTIVGYARFHKDAPHKPHMFLAFDDDTARAMATRLIGDQPSLTLPLHPYSRLASAFEPKPVAHAWSAGMACSLAPGPFDDYYAQLQAGKRLPGRVIWPVAFDVA